MSGLNDVIERSKGKKGSLVELAAYRHIQQHFSYNCDGT